MGSLLTLAVANLGPRNEAVCSGASQTVLQISSSFVPILAIMNSIVSAGKKYS